jgi:hypothetical protein
MTGNGQFNLAPSRIHIEFPRTAELSGQVFVDDNANDQKDSGEPGLDGVAVQLTGRDSLGRAVNLMTLTQDDGQFAFGPMLPGAFTIQVLPPQRYQDSGLDGIPGTVDGTPVGIGAVNEVTAITLADGGVGIDYLLPLEPNPN